MNVINPESVAAFCAEMAGRATTEPLAAWLVRNLRNHVLRTPGLHVPVAPGDVEAMVESGTLGEIPAWLGNAVARGDALLCFDPEAAPVQALSREVGRLLDRYNAEPGTDMSRISYAEAVSSTERWEREQSRLRVADFAARNDLDIRTATAMLARRDASVGSLWPESPGDTHVIVELPDGHRLVELATAPALRREGSLMDHCVETYEAEMLDGSSRILSLRDAGNMPLATLELRRPRSLGMGIVGRFLPKELSVAVQIRGPHNLVPTDEALAALAETMEAATVAATDRECRWLGLPDSLRAVSHLDVSAMAAAMPSIIRENGGGPTRVEPAVAQALRILLLHLDRLADAETDALASGLVPAPSEVGRRVETLSEVPAASQVVWTVPNLMLTGSMAPLAQRSGDLVTAAFRSAALTILKGVSESPTSAHRVEASVGSWRDPLHFFAWCGLAAEWASAVESSRARRRDWLDAERHRLKTLLRNPNLDEATRSATQNAVNVQIPRLLAGCAPPPPRPAPAPVRKPFAFRLPTRPAPRRRA